MRSLFILSLPRSLSTEVHAACCTALGLRGPGWTSAGEIMNPDRSALFAGRSQSSLKYTTPENPVAFTAAEEFLSQVTAPTGFCYKDVVQPFVVSGWLHANRRIAVLKVIPRVAHVAYAMLARRWLYPGAAAGRGDSMEERLVAGLMRAARTIEGVPGEAVAYDALCTGPEPLREALARLYPGREIPPVTFGPDFEASRERVLRQRAEPAYRALEEIERALGAPVSAAA